MAITDQQRIQIDLHYSIVAKTARGQSVREMLEERAEVKAAGGKLWLTHTVYNQTTSAVSSLVCWYLWYEDQHGQSVAKNALSEYLERDSVEALFCVWVFGIKPSERYEFDGISLVPVEMMPDSRQRDSYQALIQNRDSPVAYGAFTKPVEIPRVVSDKDEAGRVYKSVIRPAEELLVDVALLVNGIEGLSCLPHWSCVYHSAHTPFGLFWPGGTSGTCFDIVGVHSRDFCGNHAESLGDMINGYQRVASDERTKRWLGTILERIRNSKRQQETANKILDLGIAAEMLLLQDLGERDPISFPFRFRGSWLLGRDFQDRMKMHDSLKKFYGYRCQVAHNGSFERYKDEKSARGQLPEFYSIVERILQLALRPEYPKSPSDWLNLILGKDGQTSSRS